MKINHNLQDTKNGYTCTCMHGYVGNGYKCSIPVNECKDGTHDCDYHANCKDLDNGYMCVCDAKQVSYVLRISLKLKLSIVNFCRKIVFSKKIKLVLI